MALVDSLIDATSHLPLSHAVSSASGKLLDAVARVIPANVANACDPTDCSCHCWQCGAGTGPCACCPVVYCC